MAKKIKSILKTRTDTASAFAAKNIELHRGELAYESDTNRFKIGDGISKWNDLPYIVSSSKARLTNLVTTIVEKENGHKFLSLKFCLEKNDIVNEKILNGTDKIKVELYKQSFKKQTLARKQYNRWVHPITSIGVFSGDFRSSLSTSIGDMYHSYRVLGIDINDVAIPLNFEITRDNYVADTKDHRKSIYLSEEYDLSELARQMVFYSNFSEICPAEYIATSEGINHQLEPRMPTCSDFCHVIGKHTIGMTHLFYKFKITIGDIEYWSDIIKITYTKSTAAGSAQVDVGIRIA